MRYAGLFLALGLLVATASSAYADCGIDHQRTASQSGSSAPQTPLKRSQSESQG